MLRGPDTTPLSRACFPAALSPATAPVSSAATIHCGPPASQPRIQRYIIIHGRLEASSLHSSLALHHSQHHWGKPSSRHQNQAWHSSHSTLRQYDYFKTLILYMCGTVVVTSIQPYGTTIYIYLPEWLKFYSLHAVSFHGNLKNLKDSRKTVNRNSLV